MTKFGPSSDTDPSLLSLIHEASLYDDCEFSLHLESNFVDDADSTGLEEVFDPPLTSSPFITSSYFSTPMESSVSNLNLLAFALPLA